MKQQVADGVDSGIHHAQVLSFSDTDLLWSLGLLGVHSPEVLMNTVVIMLGLSCCLRAGEEDRSLHSPPFDSQFSFLYDDNGVLYFKYKEDVGNKTNKREIKQWKLEPKEVYMYQASDASHCSVRIINYYLSLLPEKCTCKVFYLQPRKKYSPTSWFLNKLVGVNTLRNIVKNLCEKAGIPGYFTNHTLRASSCTRMYGNNVEEQVIKEISGQKFSC